MTTEQIIIIGAVAAFILLLGVLVFCVSRKSKNKNKKLKEASSIQEARIEEPKEILEPVQQEPHITEVQPEPVVEEEQEEEESFTEEEQPERSVEVVNGRQIFVQYNYSFKAKLILSSVEVQEEYKKLIHYVKSYGVKTSISWKQERIYLGRNTYAMLVFKGKKLCVAYALDPKEFEDTKYRIIDLSEIKRFVKVPTLIKLSSERKQKYALELFDLLFARENLEAKEIEAEEIIIPKRTKEELIEENLIKVYTSDDIEEGVTLKQANVEDIIRKNITIQEAKTLITDESVLEYVEEVEGLADRVYTKKDIINIDTLSKAFEPNDYVNLEALKEKKLIGAKVDYVKVLARGSLDKPLIVEAQDYSLDAIKMIILTGGEARRSK